MPPRGARRHRARDPPRGVPSGRLASLLAPSVLRGPQSELAFRPPTRRPRPPASRDLPLEALGIKLRLVFQPAAGQTAETFAVHTRRPRALHGQGRTRAGGGKGPPLSARFPQSPHGPRVGGCLTFHYSPSSEPAGVCSEPSSVCLRGDRGLCAPRGPPPPTVPGWIASPCGFPKLGLGIITSSRRPESRGEAGYPHHHSKGHRLHLPCLTFHGGRFQGPVEIGNPMLAAHRGARGLSCLQLTGDQVPLRHKAPEFAFHVFHQYSQNII